MGTSVSKSLEVELLGQRIRIFVIFFFIVVRTLNMRSILLAYFKMYSNILLAIGTRLDSRSLELIHLQ